MTWPHTSTAFSRAMRALEADGFGRSLTGLLLTVILFGVWVAWSVLGRVDLYEVTDRARLEVARASTVLQAPVDGRVAASHLALGNDVKAGDVLLELDARAERLQLQEGPRSRSRLRHTQVRQAFSAPIYSAAPGRHTLPARARAVYLPRGGH